jgi:zinc protease
MRALREEPIDSSEMERVRRIFDARWLRRFESMEGQANYLADWEALGDWKLGDEYYEKFMSVTAEEVHRVVRQYLTPDRAGIVVYRPESAESMGSDAREVVARLEAQPVEPLEQLVKREEAITDLSGSPPRLERVVTGVLVFRTSNGIPILVRPKPGAAIVHIAVQSAGGVRDETAENAGLTTLAMRTTLKGTSTRTAAQIAEDSEMLGGSIGTSVGSEGFGWATSVPVQHLEAAVELLADVVYDATIPDDAFATERTIALADIAALRDDMFRYPMRLAVSAAYGDHPYSLSPLGTEESLRSATVEQVRQWYHGKLLRSPLVVGIVGDVVPEDAAAVIASAFRSTEPFGEADIDAPEWPDHERIATDIREKAQTALALGFRGPARTDPRRFAAQLTATIASGLGGRFFDELRDRQSLAYTVHAFTSEHSRAGMFLSYIATSPEKEDIARQGLLNEFAKLREAPVSDEELERARRYSLGAHAIRQESGGAQLAEMLDAWMFGGGLSELEEYEASVESVTADDILALAEEFFDPSRRVEGIVRGQGKIA